MTSRPSTVVPILAVLDFNTLTPWLKMANRWQAGLLLVVLAIAGGCDAGRADKGGGGAPKPGNLAKDDGGQGEGPLPENIDGTYMRP